MPDPVIEARQRVERARAELKAAEAERLQQRQVQLTAQLSQVREELRQARSRHQALTKRLHAERQDRDNAQAKVMAVLEQLSDSRTARPAVAEWLPDDVEVVQWRKAHEALEARRDQFIRQRDQLADPEVTTAEANRDAMRIQQLEFSEQNLLRALSGKGAVVRFEGSVSTV